MSSSLSENNLEKKFQAVTNTQDSIQTLSLWLLHHKAHHHKIVASWMKVLQKAKINHRLTLFYLANDVVQNSKRKGFLLFVNSYAEVLKEATLLVRDEQIRSYIQRVFTIWDERSIYSSEFIADLRAILTNSKVPATAPSKLLADFKPDMVIKKLRSVLKIDQEATTKSSAINLNKLNATEAELVQQLKDRTHGQQFKTDFDENIRNLEELVEIRTQEIALRNELILLLEQSEIYYDTQRGEAKVVANAYEKFDGKVKALEKKLGELITTFPSPLPSPSVDAPSPTTSDQELELNLPAENESTWLKAGIQSVQQCDPLFPEENGMTSWLGAFSSKKEPSVNVPSVKVEPKTTDSSSLDSRLSSLLQSIPNLPSGLPNSLFNNISSGNNTPQCDSIDAPVISKKDKLSEPSTVTGSLTPVKDEYSGQNTPLQDEDTHSSHSFFSKLASTNKSQSPKDILKGLTNLIQSATGDKEENQRKEKFSSYSSTELYDQQGGMSTFIKSIIPSVSQSPQLSSTSSAYFNSPPSSLTVAERTASSALSTTVSSYQTATFDNMPSYSSLSPPREEHLSYIPSLVPSTPLDNFSFPSETFSSDEYNPEMEIFDTEMDLENPIEDSDIDVPSPEIEPLSPPGAVSVDAELPRSSIGGRRLSTLITVVTEDSPDDNLPTETTLFPSDDMYKSDKENVTQDLLPPWNETCLRDNISVLTDDNIKNSPNEEFFIGKSETNSIPSYFTTAPPPPPPLPPLPIVPPPSMENGKFLNPITTTLDSTLSRIETVQTQREDVNGRWFGNNWSENNRQSNITENSPPIHFRPPGTHFFNHNRNFPGPQNFRPRNNWSPRQRPDNSFMKRNHSFSPRPYGPPPFKRFPFRGRGWGRNQPQY